MAAAQKQRDSIYLNFRQQRQESKTKPTEVQRELMQQNRTEMESIRNEAQTLALKYNLEIQNLYAEIATPKETWKKDLSALHQKFAPALSPAGNYRRGGHHRIHPQVTHLLRPVPFLFLDVKKPVTDLENLTKNKTKVFPNPAELSTTLEYNNKTAGKVIIKLLDEQGNLVREVKNQVKKEGSFSIKTDLTHLRSGIYFYSITTGARTEIIRFVKK